MESKTEDDMEIEFSLGELPEDVSRAFIIKHLPKRKTKVMSVRRVDYGLRLHLFTTCASTDEFKVWMDDYQKITKTSYDTTSKSILRPILNYKQYLHCQHQNNGKLTRFSNNCSSRVTFKLHDTKKPSRSKDTSRRKLIKAMPCEIELILSHDHYIGGSLREDDNVSEGMQEKLIGLFIKGHSPATALQVIKTDIYLDCNEDCEKFLAGRKHCPDYSYCQNLYMPHFKEKYKTSELTLSKKDMAQRLVESNGEMKDNNCARMTFHDSDYIICICPPLSKRAHQHCESASEVVFLDSMGTIDNGGSKMFVLLTHGECGGVPLGVIITSSEKSNIIQMGFQLLKDMMGDEIFGGRPDGPQIFLTDDSVALKIAIKKVWKKSKCLLCSFHVLQSVWRWLKQGKSDIPELQQYVYFNDFKSILYSETAYECVRNYEIAKTNAAQHENYVEYLEYFWQKRELWALPYRNCLLSRDNTMYNMCEAAMRIVEDKIFNRVRTFNVVQMIDFISTRFVTYYEKRLLKAAENRQQEEISVKSSLSVYLPPVGLLERISVLSDNIVAVPSESTPYLVYVVNLDALTCTCFVGNSKRMCKHVHWAAIVKPIEDHSSFIDDTSTKQCLHYIATGIRNESFSPSHHNESQDQTDNVIAASANSA